MEADHPAQKRGLPLGIAKHDPLAPPGDDWWQPLSDPEVEDWLGVEGPESCEHRQVRFGTMRDRIHLKPGWDKPITEEEFLSGEF